MGPIKKLKVIGTRIKSPRAHVATVRIKRLAIKLFPSFGPTHGTKNELLRPEWEKNEFPGAQCGRHAGLTTRTNMVKKATTGGRISYKEAREKAQKTRTKVIPTESKQTGANGGNTTALSLSAAL